MSVELIQGDCLQVLAGMAADSVHCVVTSPPYYGLRDYGTGTWEGGEAGCDHKAPPMRTNNKPTDSTATFHGGNNRANEPWPNGTCGKCGARRVDRQIGLEDTPAAYVARLVAVFREVRRVLHPSGVCFINCGDSYASGEVGRHDAKLGKRPTGSYPCKGQGEPRQNHRCRTGTKPKDLLGIPWQLVQALRDPYYTGRIKNESDRVWMAATLDAEGCICGFTHQRKDDGRIRTGVVITITNSSMAMLDHASAIWPARLFSHHKPHSGHLGKLETHRWAINGTENRIQFLREIYPYLVVKRKQAVVAYTLLLLVRDAKRLGHSVQAEEVRQKRDVLVSLLSDLNKCRPCDIPDWCKDPPSVFEPGWFLRSEITLCKIAPMPESVRDRPTTAAEKLFLLTKEPRYYYDQEAERVAATPASRIITGKSGSCGQAQGMGRKPSGNGVPGSVMETGSTRNLWNWWEWRPEPFAEAHFATFPTWLPRRCIRLGTSEKGCCPRCLTPWRRVVERESNFGKRKTAGVAKRESLGELARTTPVGRTCGNPLNKTTGWQPTCSCGEPTTVPATVLDPFAGSGTTVLVAHQLGRRGIGVELSAEYINLARRRIANAGLVKDETLAGEPLPLFEGKS